MRKILSLLTAVLFVGTMWADPIVLFHETFGNKTTSGTQVFTKDLGVQSGVSAVYSDVAYTITNAKQSRNTTGQTQSPLMQTTSGTDAVFEFGPLHVSTYNSLVLTYYWSAASINGTYSTSVSYKTSSMGSWTSVSKTSGSDGATTFQLETFNLPAAAQVSTLYLKIVWNTSNTQGKIDEVELKGVASSDPSIVVSPASLDFGTVEKDAVVAAKTFSLTGLNLTDANDVTVTAPTGYKVSIGEADPATSLTLTPSSGSISATTIKVTPVTSAAGTFNDNITISSEDLEGDSTVALTMTVVTPVPVTGVTLDQTELSLFDGDTETLTATVAPNDATNKNVTWESDDEDIATVDENGLVTAVATGTATITCKSVADPTKSATCTVTVTGPDVTLDFTQNDWGISVASTKTEGTNTYTSTTSGGYSVTLYGPSKEGYYFDTDNLMIGKSGAYMELPLFANKAIAKVITEAVSAGSASVTFNVYQGDKEVSDAATSCKVDHTFVIKTGEKRKNVAHSIKITNSQNARFGIIKIYLGEPDAATAVDNTTDEVKAVKTIVNGQLFIEKNGKVYNILGTLVK